MKLILENEQLEIKYIPGNGAWKYHLIIPNTKDIKGKWGELKVSGKIDDYLFKNKNLAPVKDSDKKISLNSEIRSFIGKGGGDIVKVTLYLINEKKEYENEDEMILECFKDADVLNTYNSFRIEEQNEIIQNINSAATENKKIERILKAIAKLEQLN